MLSKRQRFAARRKALGFSQERLAERLGVERSTVVRWEAGDTEPQPWHRPKIAQLLQVSVDQFDELLAEGGSRQLWDIEVGAVPLEGADHAARVWSPWNRA